MDDSQPEMDAEAEGELLKSLKDRLVKSGEWFKMLQLLEVKLNSSGWTDDLRAHVKGRARAQSKLNLQDLLTEAMPYGRDTVPVSVKQDLTQLIREWVEKNVEE